MVLGPESRSSARPCSSRTKLIWKSYCNVGRLFFLRFLNIHSRDRRHATRQRQKPVLGKFFPRVARPPCAKCSSFRFLKVCNIEQSWRCKCLYDCLLFMKKLAHAICTELKSWMTTYYFTPKFAPRMSSCDQRHSFLGIV